MKRTVLGGHTGVGPTASLLLYRLESALHLSRCLSPGLQPAWCPSSWLERHGSNGRHADLKPCDQRCIASVRPLSSWHPTAYGGSVERELRQRDGVSTLGRRACARKGRSRLDHGQETPISAPLPPSPSGGDVRLEGDDRRNQCTWRTLASTWHHPPRLLPSCRRRWAAASERGMPVPDAACIDGSERV
jgi:hypothetical protein